MNTVRIERDGPLMWLVLDDAERLNPLAAQTIEGLRAGLAEAAGDDSVRAVIFRAEGKHFSAGVDLKTLEALADQSYEQNLADSRIFESLFHDLLPHPKLTIAAVHGAAVGGGCGLATACDFVVAAESARFCYTEVKIGFVPAVVSTYLVRRIPGHEVRKLLLDPEFIPAEEAKKIGLVDEVVPAAELVESAREFALRVCRKAPATSIAATKKVLFESVSRPLHEALRAATEVNSIQRTTADCKHGVATFLARKATPDWLEDS